MSGLINPCGAPAGVIRAVIDGAVVAVASRHLLDEIGAVLARPRLHRWIDLEDAAAFLGALEHTALVVPDPDATSPRVRDPDDDYLVALAATSGAVIVTGDEALLAGDLLPPAITQRSLLARLARS